MVQEKIVKVLYLSNKPLYPSVDGGCMAMHQFLDLLLRGNCQVKHITISTEKHPYDAEQYPVHLREQVDPEAIEIDTQVHILKALPYLLTGKSYNVARFYSSQMADRLTSLVQQTDFDCIVLDSLFSSPYLPTLRKLFKGKILVRTHNVEADIWRDLAIHTSNWAKRLLLSKLSRDLRRYEISTLSHVDGILAITGEDLERFRELGIHTDACVIPVNMEVKETPSSYPPHLFHVGAMDWGPNIDAVNDLLRLFPQLKARIPALELHIAGRHALEVLSAPVPSGVYISDFVPDLSTFMRRNGILAAPIQSGSGVRIKILEAMAEGLPVVTTPKGAMGIEYQHNDALLIAENDEVFVNHCLDLVSSENLRREKGLKGRQLIEQFHSSESIIPKLLEFLQRT